MRDGAPRPGPRGGRAGRRRPRPRASARTRRTTGRGHQPPRYHQRPRYGTRRGMAKPSTPSGTPASAAPDLRRQLGRDALVGVEAEHPGLRRGVERDLLLRPVARPGVVDHARRVRGARSRPWRRASRRPRRRSRRTRRRSRGTARCAPPRPGTRPRTPRRPRRAARAAPARRSLRRGRRRTAAAQARRVRAIRLRSQVGVQQAHARGRVRRPAERALELDEVLDAPPAARNRGRRARARDRAGRSCGRRRRPPRTSTFTSFRSLW